MCVYGITTITFLIVKTVSTFVKTKVLTEFSIGTLGFSVGKFVKP